MEEFKKLSVNQKLGAGLILCLFSILISEAVEVQSTGFKLFHWFIFVSGLVAVSISRYEARKNKARKEN